MNIFITGGTRGIGFGLVNEFLKLNHRVTFTGTSKESIQGATSKLTGDFLGVVCDVRHKEQIEQAKDISIKTYGKIDIWINNAGVDQNRLDVSELSEDEIKRVVDINIVGMMLGTSVALSQMKKQGYGHVYNMEGLGSNNLAIPKTLIYGSSKHLLSYFSKGCNKELKQFKNVWVGTLSPGMVFTDLLLHDMGEDGMKIAKILGSQVEEVTPWLVKKMLKNKKRVVWLTNLKVMRKFTFSFLKK
ncbi:SDR family oxidoreductase [Patescibacteria group bacterium]|nr:SDR family oxidoreductase [Patescibacteria group bacterium]MBU1094180.1 SDR family oxidoreductase [Bacillota bacterium]